MILFLKIIGALFLMAVVFGIYVAVGMEIEYRKRLRQAKNAKMIQTSPNTWRIEYGK